jgi:hypothetical protein
MKLKLFIVLIFLGLFLLGCGPDTNGFEGPLTDTSKTGTKEMTVKTTNFPTVSFQNRRLQGDFIITNKAGYPAENVKLSLVGLDKRYVTLQEDQQTINFIEGRSLFQDEGGFETFKFIGEVNKLLPSVESERLNYLILLEYSSRVEFSPTICVDSGLYSVGSGCNFGERDSGLRSKPTKQTFSGQGAPVLFSSLEVIPYTGDNAEVELRLEIRKRGSGNIKSLRLGRSALGNIPLECEFRGRHAEQPNFIEFKDRKTLQDIDLICTGRLESGVAYESALFVEIFYDYEYQDRKSLEIRR